MNAWIRAGLVIGALALLPAASASATPPKAEDLPPGSGLLIPPGGEDPGSTYRFEAPPRLPGRFLPYHFQEINGLAIDPARCFPVVTLALGPVGVGTPGRALKNKAAIGFPGDIQVGLVVTTQRRPSLF